MAKSVYNTKKCSVLYLQGSRGTSILKHLSSGEVKIISNYWLRYCNEGEDIIATHDTDDIISVALNDKQAKFVVNIKENSLSNNEMDLKQGAEKFTGTLFVLWVESYSSSLHLLWVDATQEKYKNISLECFGYDPQDGFAIITDFCKSFNGFQGTGLPNLEFLENRKEKFLEDL